MTTIKKSRLLIIFARNTGDTSTRFGGFVKRIVKNGGFAYSDVDYVALEDLIFHIKDKRQASIVDPVRNIDIKSYDFVYFKSWQAFPELAASVAHFLEGMGIPYADKQVRHEYISKTTNYMTMWTHHVSVPETIWGAKLTLLTYLHSTKEDQYPLIVKAVHGQKGNDNYLVYTKQEAIDIVEASEKDMLLQQFIPNTGDYRIGVYGHQSKWAIFRRSGGKSHLNNTSAGGVAELLVMEEIDPKVIRIAEQAAAACDMAFSGVDVVEDSLTHELYIFEANQGSQIVTGAFADSNMQAFDNGMKSLMVERHGKKKRPSLELIGRHVLVDVEDTVQTITLEAKVDTGAYQSSLHVEEADLRTDETGLQYVHYVLKNPETDIAQEARAYTYWRATVKNSFGVAQERYVIPMHLRIHGVQYETRVSLADRTTQKYPLLIGRKLLSGNFLVNVELGELNKEELS